MEEVGRSNRGRRLPAQYYLQQIIHNEFADMEESGMDDDNAEEMSLQFMDHKLCKNRRSWIRA